MITVSVITDLGAPVIGAGVILSGTNEFYYQATDSVGQAVLTARPENLSTYEVQVSKTGYSSARIPITPRQVRDTTPPPVVLMAPV